MLKEIIKVVSWLACMTGCFIATVAIMKLFIYCSIPVIGQFMSAAVRTTLGI